APQAHARVEAGLARRAAREAGGHLVDVEAFEAVADEGVEAPVLGLQLEPDARAVQVRALALVEVEQRLIALVGRPLVRAALVARRVADAERTVLQQVDERIARGRG